MPEPIVVAQGWDWDNLTDEQAEAFAELLAGLATNNKVRATQAAQRMEKRGVKFGITEGKPK